MSRSALKSFAKFAAAGTTASVVAYYVVNDEVDGLMYSIKKSFKGVSTSPQNKQKPKKKVVVLGSGWGAMSCIQQLDAETTDLKVISPRSFFFYTPLLAGMATGTVNHSSIMEPIRWHSARFGDSTFLQAICSDVDFKNSKVECHGADGSKIIVDYDQLIIAVGAEPATFGIPGVKENAVFMKEVEDGMEVHRRVLESLERASTLLANGAPDDAVNKELHWVIIGGGPTGVELSAELSDFLRRDVTRYFPKLRDRVKISLLEATGKILAVFDPKISAYAQKTLIEQGVEVLCGAMVTKIDTNSIKLKNNGIPTSIDYGIVVWAGGIATRPFVSQLVDKIGATHQNSRRGLVVDALFRVKGIESFRTTAAAAAAAAAAGEASEEEGQAAAVTSSLPASAAVGGWGGWFSKPSSAVVVSAKPTLAAELSPQDLAERRNVWAIGDCAITGCPPTAQAAYQQGKYLGRFLRDTEYDPKKIEQSSKIFEYQNYGALAYVGSSKGVAELKTILWDKYPARILQKKETSAKQQQENAKSGENKHVVVEGSSAFAIWRSLYFSRLLSGRNRAQVAFDWMKAGAFGRDISSPYNQLSTESKK